MMDLLKRTALSLICLTALCPNTFTKEITPDVENPVTKTAPSLGTEELNIRVFLSIIQELEKAEYDMRMGGRRFKDLSFHPGFITLTIKGKETKVSPSGAYQITFATFEDIGRKEGISSFYPTDQDKLAIGIIKRSKAYDLVKKGKYLKAFKLLDKRWSTMKNIDKDKIKSMINRHKENELKGCSLIASPVGSFV